MLRVKVDHMPDFTRMKWVSARAKEVWEPRVKKIIYASSIIERSKNSSLQSVNSEELVRLSEWATDNNKKIIILGRQNYDPSAIYSTLPPRDFDERKPIQYRVVVGHPDTDEILWRAAWKDTNHHVIGSLLHYPACCVIFFETAWKKEGFIDTSWPMAMHTFSHRQGIINRDWKNPVEFHDIPWQNNILLRWAGIRAVSHLPCSFTCKKTKLAADINHQIGVKLGFVDEMRWLQEMLSWPVEWSALHGIAEIKCPILSIMANTDVTGEKYTIQLLNNGYPAEGTAGNVFPFKSFRGLQIERRKPIPESTYWTDNGFNSLEAMEMAHGPILRLAGNCINVSRIVDFGCGSGVLLQKLGEIFPAAEMVGVDSDRDRAAKARLRLPHATILDGDFTKLSKGIGKIDLALFTPAHLIGASSDFIRVVNQTCRMALVYAYSDHLDLQVLETVRGMGLTWPTQVGENNGHCEVHLLVKPWS
jgi:Methyltransferase domain